MKRSTRGLGGVYQRGNRWWIYYSCRGKLYRESAGSTEKSAVLLLKRRHGEMGRGQIHGPSIERTTFEDLAKMIIVEYAANGRDSMPRLKTALNALRQKFGMSLACDITLDRLNSYVTERLATKRMNRKTLITRATVKYELAILRKAFRLAVKADKAICPPFPTISLNNTRKGFFEREQFLAVQAHLPPYLHPVMTFAYVTGWRIPSEVLTLQWKQVDFHAGVVRLDPGTTKNDEGRTFPFTVIPDLAMVLRQQWNETMTREMKTGVSVPWVFHHSGKPILNFYGAWRNACEAAGVPDRIPHDFRRTAVRNLERAGVPRSVAMKLTGHKTENVYRRYAIVSEADLSDGLKKLAALNAQEAKRPKTFTELSQFQESEG